MKVKLLDHKQIPGFNSGPGLEFHGENIYITDSESKEVLVMSQHWKELERIPLFEPHQSSGVTAHKDLDASTIVNINSIPRLLALGSDTDEARHNRVALLNLDDRTREDHTIDQFDERLQAFGIDEVNIRAAAVILGKLVLGNRRSAGTGDNNFIVTDIEVWKKQETEEISLLTVKYPDDAPTNLILTGMSYSHENDWLLLTFNADVSATSKNVSETSVLSELPQGSYLALVENASRKVSRQKIKINELVSLTKVSKQFDGHQVKAVCLQMEKNGKVKLYLAADDQDGGTHLYKIRVKH